MRRTIFVTMTLAKNDHGWVKTGKNRQKTCFFFVFSILANQKRAFYTWVPTWRSCGKVSWEGIIHHSERAPSRCRSGDIANLRYFGYQPIRSQCFTIRGLVPPGAHFVACWLFWASKRWILMNIHEITCIKPDFLNFRSRPIRSRHFHVARRLAYEMKAEVLGINLHDMMGSCGAHSPLYRSLNPIGY